MGGHMFLPLNVGSADSATAELFIPFGHACDDTVGLRGCDHTPGHGELTMVGKSPLARCRGVPEGSGVCVISVDLGPPARTRCASSSFRDGVVGLDILMWQRVWLSLSCCLREPASRARALPLVSFTNVTTRRAPGERLAHDTTHDAPLGVLVRPRVRIRIADALHSSVLMLSWATCSRRAASLRLAEHRRDGLRERLPMCRSGRAEVCLRPMNAKSAAAVGERYS